MNATPLSSTDRTRLGRVNERGLTDRSNLYEMLDGGLVCHLGVVVDGSPRVIPTGYGRDGDTLYIHGSTGARSLIAGQSQEVCVTVTHLDGLVLARSLFHHSMNYRSAIIFGVPRLVTDPDEKLAGLRAVTEQLAPGQWDVARLPTRKELAGTAVLALSLEEASVKIRTGPPSDEDEDYALDIWAGVVPVRQVFDAPVSDPRLRPGIPVPSHVTDRPTPARAAK
ncbi:pyridoxamine 5'-phosphate oxidase family protein [Actinomadura fulvescens]|uniref:Pyridoxamine 5'-phosphate oxidase family protein n=1 Tax=Actinomadura fulvescens TaxID=46160 RepID=A0ABP6C2H9_9ACTN